MELLLYYNNFAIIYYRVIETAKTMLKKEVTNNLLINVCSTIIALKKFKQ